MDVMNYSNSSRALESIEFMVLVERTIVEPQSYAILGCLGMSWVQLFGWKVWMFDTLRSPRVESQSAMHAQGRPRAQGQAGNHHVETCWNI